MCYRYICNHLGTFQSGDTFARLTYLKKLVDADDSCFECLEYVEILLNQGNDEDNYVIYAACAHVYHFIM